MKIEIPISDKQFEKTSKSQKEFLLEAADKIRRGEKLVNFKINPKITEAFACEFVAAALRGAAKALPIKQPKSPGRPSTIPNDFPFLFWVYKDSLGSENKVFELFAEKYGVSITALKKKVGKAGSPEEKALAQANLDEAKNFYDGIKNNKKLNK